MIIHAHPIPKPEPLDEEASNTIKKELSEKKTQIEGELHKITATEQSESDEHKAMFPEYGDKLDENAQEISEYTTNLATEKILEASLRDINSALKRIADGTYGTCKYCGQPIGKKRLLARPVASACIECKTKLQSTW